MQVVALVALVDQVEVARYIAFKDKPETAAERKHKDAMKDQKAALIEALHQKCKCASAPPFPGRSSHACPACMQPQPLSPAMFVLETVHTIGPCALTQVHCRGRAQCRPV